MKEPVDIIVVTYNRINYIKSFIEFLYLSTQYPFRLIVVDNGSTDGTRELVLKLEEEGVVWKHVFNASNLLLASAQTEGLKVVESELFIVSDDDMKPPLFKNPDWLEIFVAKIKGDESIGCVNFIGHRCSFSVFQIRSRPGIEARIKSEGGWQLERFNQMQKLLYDK